MKSKFSVGQVVTLRGRPDAFPYPHPAPVPGLVVTRVYRVDGSIPSYFRVVAGLPDGSAFYNSDENNFTA